MSAKEIALVTYTTRPRGGVVHTLSLAEALTAAGVPVHIVTLAEPGSGFYLCRRPRLLVHDACRLRSPAAR